MDIPTSHKDNRKIFSTLSSKCCHTCKRAKHENKELFCKDEDEPVKVMPWWVCDNWRYFA